MKWIFRILRKIFLVKSIMSQEGELHFERFRLFSTPWLRLYVHKICLPDYDLHMHGHPWNFFSFILRGGYTESFTTGPSYNVVQMKMRPKFSLVHHDRTDVHHIENLNGAKTTWTLVLGYGRYENWGYRFRSNPNALGLDTWVSNSVYREMKRNDHFDAFGNLVKPATRIN